MIKIIGTKFKFKIDDIIIDVELSLLERRSEESSRWVDN